MWGHHFLPLDTILICFHSHVKGLFHKPVDLERTKRVERSSLEIIGSIYPNGLYRLRQKLRTRFAKLRRLRYQAEEKLAL